jgi:hypothetical protein
MSKFLCLFPTVGSSALANEFAVERSPYPLGAAAATPGFVVGVLTIWMVAGVDGKHEHADRPNTENALRRKVDLILSNVEDWIKVDITLKEVEKFQQLTRGRCSTHLP